MRTLTTFLAAAALSGTALAQAPVAVTPPTTVTPPATALQPRVTVNPQLLIGRWQFIRDDPDTRSSDQIIVEFLKDGRYTTLFRNSLFPGDTHSAQGRFAILGVQPNAIDVRIERQLDEPETDKEDAVELQRLTVLDNNSLQAADGSIARRVK